MGGESEKKEGEEGVGRLERTLGGEGEGEEDKEEEEEERKGEGLALPSPYALFVQFLEP